MSSLNVARIANKLRSLFVLRGGPPPAPEVADEIFPVVVMEDERPEHFFLGNEALMMDSMLAPAFLGEGGWVRLNNPSTSNTLAILEYILVSPFVAVTTCMVLIDHIDAPSETGTTIGRVRDQRLNTVAGANYTGALTISNGTEVGPVGVRLAQWRQQPNTVFRLDGPWIIDPGRNLAVETTTGNQDLLVTFAWRERGLEKGEER